MATHSIVLKIGVTPEQVADVTVTPRDQNGAEIPGNISWDIDAAGVGKVGMSFLVPNNTKKVRFTPQAAGTAVFTAQDSTNQLTITIEVKVIDMTGVILKYLDVEIEGPKKVDNPMPPLGNPMQEKVLDVKIEKPN